jgi:hypothetical protein
MAEINIIGAGLSGLLAANMLMGHGHKVIVHEVANSLPNNHKALLRFRSSVIGDTLGIPFKKVKVLKSVQDNFNPVADAMSYSFKVTGGYSLRSIASVFRTEMVERYIAPDDLVERMYARAKDLVEFRFSQPINLADMKGKIVVSTIDMSSAVSSLYGDSRSIAFKYMPISLIRFKMVDVEVNAYATVYIPNPDVPLYRASITGDLIILELSEAPPYTHGDFDNSHLIDEGMKFLGIDIYGVDADSFSIHHRGNGKIVAIDEAVRRKVVSDLTNDFGIYSLGRYATWRPGLLMDDLIKDLRIIQRLINGSANNYIMKE